MEPKGDKILYPYVLDQRPKFFLGWALNRLFTRVDLDEDMKETLKRMQREGTLVYAVKPKWRGASSDRFLAHATILQMVGKSYRLRLRSSATAEA